MVHRQCLFQSPEVFSKEHLTRFCSDFAFETTGREGAVLIIPDGGLSEQLQNYKLLEKYISTNAKSWWEYVESEDCGVPVQTDYGVQIVVATDKVSSWGMTTFENVEEPMQFEFGGDESKTASQTRSYTWKRISGRAGPAEDEIQDLLAGPNTSGRLCNQCVFLRTLNVSVSGKVWREAAVQETSCFNAFISDSSQDLGNIQTSKSGLTVSLSLPLNFIQLKTVYNASKSHMRPNY